MTQSFLNFDFQMLPRDRIRPFFTLRGQPALTSPSASSPDSAPQPEERFYRSDPTTIADFHLNNFFKQRIRVKTVQEFDAFKRMNRPPQAPPAFYLSASNIPLHPYDGVYLNNPNIYAMILRDRDTQKTKLSIRMEDGRH